MTSENGWIETSSGRRFFPVDPRPDDIDIYDIAHALSLQCRYNGHITRLYTVAQHSIHVASLLAPHEKLWGLLHDASESYLGDMVAPVKAQMPEFRAAENRLQTMIYQVFGLEGNEPSSVHNADMIMLNTERKQLFQYQVHKWDLEDKYPHLEDFIIPTWTPKEAEQEFLKLWRELYR